jgi:hypothetical protein
MRSRLLLILTLAAASAAFGAPRDEDADRAKLAAIYNGPTTKMSMWIWSDKYIYRAGNTITVKWTVKSNNDIYPYTTLLYIQNNQTGKKTYLPSGSEDAPNVQPAQIADATKAVLTTIPAPTETGMHTIVVELRDYTATRLLKTAYMKIGVVDKTETLSGDIIADKTLSNDTEYKLTGVVFVKNGATLRIQPGTFIFGQPGSQPPSVLVITQNGKIIAPGTASRPIVMTSSQPFGARIRGDWGGLIMLGKAPINVGANTNSNTNAAGTFFIEGLNTSSDGLYGGTDPAHSCGTLSYVRVEYAGSILSANNETNSFTWGGCGTGTVAHHLQAIYGADDSFEWFGGTMDASYLVGGLGADDYVDFQLGWTGRLQFGLFYQSPNSKGNRGIEGDNSEYNPAATPFSNPTMYNLTFIGSGVPGFDEAASPGIFLRRGARATINNVLVTNFYSTSVNISDAATQAQADLGNVKMNGILAWNNGIGTTSPNTFAGQFAGAYDLPYAQGTKGVINGVVPAKNFAVQNPLLGKPAEYSDPDFAGLFSSPTLKAGAVQPPDDGFFDQRAQFIGGISSENDWTKEWTSFLLETDIQ